MTQPTEQEKVTALLEKLSMTNMAFGTNPNNALRLGRLTSEQKLSFVLSKLVEHQKETLILMKVVNIYAEEHVTNKKRDMQWEVL